MMGSQRQEAVYGQSEAAESNANLVSFKNVTSLYIPFLIVLEQVLES